MYLIHFNLPRWYTSQFILEPALILGAYTAHLSSIKIVITAFRSQRQADKCSLIIYCTRHVPEYPPKDFDLSLEKLLLINTQWKVLSGRQHFLCKTIFEDLFLLYI